MRGWLKPGVLLVLHVPHWQPLTFWVRDRLRKLQNAHPETFCTLYKDIHISGFDRASLRKVVERAGFETCFVTGAGMWSKYYDPFFWGNYAREAKWSAAGRKAVRHAVEWLGYPIGRADWVIGYFRRPE